MYLFFDGVSSRGFIALLDKQKNIISSDSFYISGNESTQTIPIIDMFLESEEVDYKEIENIICVVGPGSFTGIRTISLVVNTLAYIYKNIRLTSVNFFDLYNMYPIVKSSSKRDLFVKRNKSDIITVMSNQDFEISIDTLKLYGDTNTDRFSKKFSISSEIDYAKILRDIVIADSETVAPLYIKKPNIS